MFLGTAGLRSMDLFLGILTFVIQELLGNIVISPENRKNEINIPRKQAGGSVDLFPVTDVVLPIIGG